MQVTFSSFFVLSSLLNLCNNGVRSKQSETVVGLPALPREMNGRVSYDWQNDTFRLARGDAGLTETRLGEITELGGGRVQVAGALVSLEDESVLCSFTVDLVRNNSMFGYAISGLDIL